MNRVVGCYDGTPFITTLEKASLDDGGSGKCMVHSRKPVVCFDKVKDDYVRNLDVRPDSIPKSVDAMFAEDDDLVLVEFKNGKLGGKIGYEVRKKVYDSLLILGDKHGLTIGLLRDKGVFVLVYNPEKNPDREGDRRPSKSKTDIAQRLARRAGKRFIRFDMEPFEGYCFREVHTMTPDEFDRAFA